MMAIENLHQVMNQMAQEIVEECALVVEEIPASASLYESAGTAKAVIEFKQRAAAAIRSLNNVIP